MMSPPRSKAGANSGRGQNQGKQNRQQAQPEQPTGPTAADERMAHRENAGRDQFGQRMADAQDRIHSMRANEYWARADSQNPVVRPGIRFDQDGNGWHEGTGAMIHRDSGEPPMPPMTARRLPPDEPFSPAAMPRVPQQPGPVSGAVTPQSISEAIEASI